MITQLNDDVLGVILLWYNEPRKMSSVCVRFAKIIRKHCKYLEECEVIQYNPLHFRILRRMNNKLDHPTLPAYESTEGVRMYYKNGVIHRDKGPAVIRKVGIYPNDYFILLYYIEGKQIGRTIDHSKNRILKFAPCENV
jgi:hypothetical protein